MASKDNAGDYPTPVITKDRKPVRVQQAVAPTPKEKQFELSDNDAELLGASQYSDKAWDVIGRKHGIDPTTRKVIEHSHNRAFTAEIKKWEPLPSAKGGTVTTRSIDSNGVYSQDEAIPADPAAIRQEMRKRDLTKPTSPEVTTEQVGFNYVKESL